MTSSKLAIAFEMMRDIEKIDARHHFTCCQSCGAAKLQSLENEDDETIGYCFYHVQDAENIAERKDLYLSYGGFETPDKFWESEDVARVVGKHLEECGLEVEWNGDAATRVKVLLDEGSIGFVEALSEGFANGQRVSYEWKYFDFDAEWDRFAEHWYSDEVQTILKESIDQLGLDSERSIGFPYASDLQRDPWRKGDAIWQLSRTYYSFRQFRDRIMKGPNNPHIAYDRTMGQLNRRLRVTDEDDFLDSETGVRAIFNLAREEKGIRSLIYTEDETFENYDEAVNNGRFTRAPPKAINDLFECTLLSLPGRAVLNDALRKVAERMFPDLYVIEVDGPENVKIVVVPAKTIIFDVFGFFFGKYEKWPGFSSENINEMFRLDQIRNGLD